MGINKDPVVVGYQYGMGLHLVVCAAATAIKKIKIGDRTAWEGNVSQNTIKVVNKPELFGGDSREGGVQGLLGMFFGNRDQDHFPRMQGMNKWNRTQRMRTPSSEQPAYRGVVSLLWHGLLSSNNPYFKSWSVFVESFPSSWYEEKQRIGEDMNPAHILYDILTTNPESGGLGLPATMIDIPSFTKAADTLYDENFGLSFSLQKSTEIYDLVSTIESHIGGQLYQNPITQSFVLRLFRDDYNIEDLPIVGEDSILSLARYSVTGWGETVNEITLKYTDPDTFEIASITVQDTAAINATGAVIAEEKTFNGIHSAELAQRVAMRELAMKSTPQSAITIDVNRTASRLQVGDVFVLSYPQEGVNRVVYRVLSIDTGTLADPTIRIEASVDVFGLPEATYTSDQPTLWTSPIQPAQAAEHIRIFEVPYYWAISVAASQLNDLDQEASLVGVVAESPNEANTSYDVIDAHTSALLERNAPMNDTAILTSEIDQEPTSTLLLDRESYINTGDYLMLGDEIVYCPDSVSGQTVNVWRGVLDTVPLRHAAGSRVWIIRAHQFGQLEYPYEIGERAAIQILPRTVSDRLDSEQAEDFYYDTARRYWRPYPPGNLLINGERYPDSVQAEASIEISWSSRSREQQTTPVPIRQDQGDVTPPEGIIYKIEVADINGELLYEEETTETTTTIEQDHLPDSGEITIAVLSVLDDMNSWMKSKTVVEIRPI